MAGRGPRRGEVGRGFVGFLAALIVVVCVGYAVKEYYTIKRRADAMNDFAYELLKAADSRKLDADGIRFEILKQAKELGVPLEGAKAIEVGEDRQGRSIRFSWTETYALPGYSRQIRYDVDHKWRRF